MGGRSEELNPQPFTMLGTSSLSLVTCINLTNWLVLWRIVCPGEGLPSELIQDMFNSSTWVTEEGLGLSMSRKILKLMDGDVQYIREAERCYFHIIIELPISQDSSGNVG